MGWYKQGPNFTLLYVNMQFSYNFKGLIYFLPAYNDVELFDVILLQPFVYGFIFILFNDDTFKF